MHLRRSLVCDANPLVVLHKAEMRFLVCAGVPGPLLTSFLPLLVFSGASEIVVGEPELRGSVVIHTTGLRNVLVPREVDLRHYYDIDTLSTRPPL